MNDDLPVKFAKIEIPGIKVEVAKEDNWETVGMIAVLILVVYLGIKTINHYFNKKKNENSLWK